MEPTQQQGAAPPPPPAPPSGGYGKRVDGTKKGNGFFGPLLTRDGSGRVSTEISVGVEIDGKEMEIPTMVPGLTKSELDHLLRGGRPTDAIVQKAVDHARRRIGSGKSPFAGDDERMPQP